MNGAPLGRLPEKEIASLLARAAIFASPVRYEPFGLAILEAALAGCALVLGDLPSLREVWGNAAVFVDPEDDAALARALQALIDDAERRARLAAEARQRALTYSPERFGDEYLELYERLLADEPLPTRERVA